VSEYFEKCSHYFTGIRIGNRLHEICLGCGYIQEVERVPDYRATTVHKVRRLFALSQGEPAGSVPEVRVER
jgi:hypothetical protein